MVGGWKESSEHWITDYISLYVSRKLWQVSLLWESRIKGRDQVKSRDVLPSTDLANFYHLALFFTVFFLIWLSEVNLPCTASSFLMDNQWNSFSRFDNWVLINHLKLSHVPVFATLWTVARQAPLPMRLSRQEYWSGLPCPPPGDLPKPGIETQSLKSPVLYH